jgi:phosphoglycolate phosphatase
VTDCFSTIEAVLFDLDGTLVETRIDFPLMKREVIRIAGAFGADSDQLAGLDILGVVGRTVYLLRSQGKHGDAARFRADALARLEEIEVAHATDTTEIPFACELVQSIRSAGARVGIVTRNCRKASLISLEIVGIRPDAMVCREDTEKHKPDPEHIHVALRVLKVSPQAAVMVGDHIMDVQGGKSAGMRTIGFLRQDRPMDFFDVVNPDVVVWDLKEALSAIINFDR